MNDRWKSIGWAIGAGAVAAGAAVFALALWLRHDPTRGFDLHRPGMDGRPPVDDTAAAENAEPIVRIGESFQRFRANPPAGPGRWPGFRGANADNIATASPPLLAVAPAASRILWSVPLGEGHAGPAVAAGRVYVLDYDETERADALRCFALADGTELWRRSYRVEVKRNHGMSRSVPAVAHGAVVTIGPRCQAMCVDAESGALRWGIDLVRAYGSTEPLWYGAQCPLIDGDEAILAPCGTNVLMMGVALSGGEVRWTTPPPDGLAMSHASIMPATIAGTRMFVYPAIGGIVGVSAESASRGRLLWVSRDFTPKVIAPSPVPVSGDRIYQTAGYGGGHILLHVEKTDGGFGVATLERCGPKDGLACEQQTPIWYCGRLFGIMPKDGGSMRSQLVCSDPGHGVVWSSGPTARFGLGPYLIADGKLILLDDDGMLHVLEASPEGYRPLYELKILDGPDAWGPMAFVDGLLLARDPARMVCVDLRVR